MKEPLTPEKATELVNALPQYADCSIDLTSHCQERMLERNFAIQDILMLLSNGSIKSSPEYDETYGHYKYKLEGPVLDEEGALAIIVILGPRSVRIVSIF